MPKKSEAWDYFQLIENETKVKCTKCGVELRHKKCTTNMILHLKQTHDITIAKLPPKGGRKRRSAQSTNGEGNETEAEDNPDSGDDLEPQPKRPTPTKSKVQTLESCVSNLNSFTVGGRRDLECTNALAYMIVKDNLPLRTPEKQGFRKFANTMQPLYKVPSEPTMTRFIQDKYKVLQAKVQSMIEKASHITVTMDLWSHKNTMRNFLGLTCCMTKGSKSITVELGCRVMDEKKTAENIITALQSYCDDWKIDLGKVRAAVSDGGLNIKNACKTLFGAEKHVACAAHKFNIIGQKCIGNLAAVAVPSERVPPLLEEPEDEDDTTGDFDEAAESSESCLRDLITKVKRTVRFFKQSSVAITKLLHLQISEQGKTEGTALKLIQEVRTRWNSCHDMIDRFLQLAPLVSRVVLECQRDKNTKSKQLPAIITAEEEEELTEVRDLLAGLARVTKEVSMKHCTISKVIPLVKNLRLDVEKFTPATGIGFNLKAHILELIKEEFGRIEEVPMFAAATLLDPRFKIVGFYNDDAKPRRVANAISYVGNLVKLKMRENQREQAAEEQRLTTQASSDDFWGEFDMEAERHTAQHAGQDTAGGMPIQLQMYLDRPLMCRKAYPDPLKAWEVIQSEYPAVYAVAQELLSILGTSVGCEQLFSHAGAIANQVRTRLSCTHLDMLVFMMSCPENLWFD